MSRFFRLLPPTIPLLIATGCGDPVGPITSLPRELNLAENRLIEADNRFAFKLFSEINQQEGDKNVFISPLSVAMALGMTYNGAAGETQQAMQKTLELEGLTLREVNESYRSVIDLLRDLDPQVEFVLANSIWYRQDYAFEQEFLEVNRKYFDAEVRRLDFADPGAPQAINGWVSDKTEGKIEQIVPSPLPPDAVMYLINAIYFNGTWAFQFDQSRTSKAMFRLKDGSEATVDMMSHGSEVEVGYLSTSGLEILDLPYGGGAYRATILVPPTPQAIDTLLQELGEENWNAWIGGLDSTSISVSIPKFQLSYELEMNDVLKALGMARAFCGHEADFSKISPIGGVCISNVIHKTFVDVDEAGTEAAAVTSVGISFDSGLRSMTVDRPFVFVIRERYSGTILFMGKILNPVEG